MEQSEFLLFGGQIWEINWEYNNQRFGEGKSEDGKELGEID